MSIVISRSPLEVIGMNGAGSQQPKRRSARLSAEGAEENEPPGQTRTNGSHVTSVSTREQDGDSGAVTKKKRKVYDEDDDGFAFSKSKRAKPSKPAAVRNSTADHTSPAKPPAQARIEESEPKPAQRKVRRGLPTTPERDAAAKPVRRSKRLSDENEKGTETSPHKPAHAKSHAKHARSPSPFKPRPVTIEKKRKKGTDGVEEEKVMRIQLPFADTPVIKRNKEMRKASAETGHRRSSSGMRGRRASSLIDEGRGNALPHSEVPSAEFFKHISAELTEPRRMRCLLGWCAQRALPPKPEPPKDSSSVSKIEFQALQAARIIQEELASDLVTKGILSDWFSRDDNVPAVVPLRKRPNPRNVANAAKAEELERELERLKKERSEWDTLIASAAPEPPSEASDDKSALLSPPRADLLDSPQRAILAQLQASTSQRSDQEAQPTSQDPTAIQQRLKDISENLEFTMDQFAHGVHALSTTRDTAERLADKSLHEAAGVLEDREREGRNDGSSGKAVDAMDALRGLARVLNGRQR